MAASTRRLCYGDDGLASVIVDIDPPRFSGNYNPLSQTVVPRRRESIRNLAASLSSSGITTTAGYPSCSSPRLGRVHDSRFEEINNHPPHFLEACFLCKKHLGINRDIFMYRGDTPFCSEECRQEQIDEDEANERKQNLSMKAIKSKKKDPSSGRISDYPYLAGTLASA